MPPLNMCFIIYGIMVTFIYNNLDAELRHPIQDDHLPRVGSEREHIRKVSREPKT